MPEIINLIDEEASEQFGRAVQKYLGISGDEFVRRWDAGECDAIADTISFMSVDSSALVRTLS